MIIGISGKIGSGKDTVGNIIKYLTSQGYKNCGKEYSYASYLTDTSGIGISSDAMSPFEIKKFADALKNMTCIILGCTREQLEDREFKEKELPEEWWYFATTVNHKKIPYLGNENFLNRFPLYQPTPRTLLQKLGTECGREILHPNVWVNASMHGYKEKFRGCPSEYQSDGSHERTFPDWIFTDMRFPNELEAVQKRGGITIRVNRPLAQATIAGKEQSISMEEFDKVLNEPVHPSETALDNAEFDYTIPNNGSINFLIKQVEKILQYEEII